MTTPRVSVVMTVYKDLRFFDEAVASVLAQDFGDLELIIVDDGSPDKTGLADVEARDARIRLLTNETNLGTAEAANRGIAVSRGEIVVRLDADDACEPERISRLVAALDADPGLGLVGSAVSFVNENGDRIGAQKMPESDADIRWTMLFHNPFYHSAAAFRRSLFDHVGGYLAHELVSQDHYLWAALAPLCRMRNLPEMLTRYRINTQGLTILNSQGRPRARTDAIRVRLWRQIGLAYDLYDDALAKDITQFLRGETLPPERAAPAFAKMRQVMAAFLSAQNRSAEALAVSERLEARMAHV